MGFKEVPQLERAKPILVPSRPATMNLCPGSWWRPFMPNPNSLITTDDNKKPAGLCDTDRQEKPIKWLVAVAW